MEANVLCILCFLSADGIARASATALRRLPFDAAASVVLVTDASSFKAVERWAALVGADPTASRVRTANLGSALAARDRVRLALSVLLAETDASSRLVLLPIDHVADVDWDLARFLMTTPSPSVAAQSLLVNERTSDGRVRVAALCISSSLRNDCVAYVNHSPGVASVVEGEESDAAAWARLLNSLKTPITVIPRDALDLDPMPLPAVSAEALAQSPAPIVGKSFARVGIMGNPSDGFFGKTISLLIKNFDATVTLSPNYSPSDLTIRIDPSPVLDPYLFASMPTLRVACEKDGYYGIHRLILATLHLFARTCAHENINLDTRRGFRVSYATNIPRQVGLAGSSAMVTALLRALLHYYALESHAAFPLHARADLAWRVEKEELGIASGLQDRVVQAYGGLMYMDFGREWMEARGYGVYECLPVEWTPKGLWIAYVGAPSDSGKIHSDVRARFFAGDEEVVKAMSHFADLATQAREALQRGDSRKFAELMEDNFSTRRSVYGDAVVGATNLAVVKVAREFGHAAKFSGSGGCVVGLWRGEEGMESVEGRREMVRRIRGFGYVFEEVVVAGEEES